MKDGEQGASGRSETQSGEEGSRDEVALGEQRDIRVSYDFVNDLDGEGREKGRVRHGDRGEERENEGRGEDGSQRSRRKQVSLVRFEGREPPPSRPTIKFQLTMFKEKWNYQVDA